MTVECLKSSMLRIERYFGKELSTDERTARAEVYAAALKEIPDDVVSAALVKALTVCRYQNQLLVDWCAEIRKIQDVGRPTANDLWNDAAVAARKIEANLYYMHIGGLITADGKLNRDDLKRRNTEIFAALPVAVQRWAGSPEDLSDIFSSRSTADLRQFVRPGFDRTVERDIYASREENWMNKAVERKETIEQLQTEVEQLTDTIAADQSIALTYAGEFQCTAYCSEEYPHICGEGQGITSSGAKVQPGVTVAADTSIFPYGTVILIEGVGMRVVQDTGSLIKENALDVAVGTHAEAISWSGWGSHKVWIVTGGETDAAE